ncbi:unnamed protein product [Miscanthus lutarioriparius]|uniref:Uncharacterized protein n=1 Tax=Miscanthus lutarioriparius TaxID=422564 RepID=A0A811MDT3_9POAL|nr:unnamed protein product [Miscanthus lutarioriparius]
MAGVLPSPSSSCGRGPRAGAMAGVLPSPSSSHDRDPRAGAMAGVTSGKEKELAIPSLAAALPVAVTPTAIPYRARRQVLAAGPISYRAASISYRCRGGG